MVPVHPRTGDRLPTFPILQARSAYCVWTTTPAARWYPPSHRRRSPRSVSSTHSSFSYSPRRRAISVRACCSVSRATGRTRLPPVCWAAPTLFSLSVLHQTDETFVPHLSHHPRHHLRCAVRAAADFLRPRSLHLGNGRRGSWRSGQTVAGRLTELVRHDDSTDPASEFDSSAMRWDLKARKSGYVSAIDAKAPAGFRAGQRPAARIEGPSGGLRSRRSAHPVRLPPTRRKRCERHSERVESEAITLSRSRNPAGDIEFSDQPARGNCRARAVPRHQRHVYRHHLRGPRVVGIWRLPVENVACKAVFGSDDTGTATAQHSGLYSLQDLLDRAYDPLRQTAQSNVLMTEQAF